MPKCATLQNQFLKIGDEECMEVQPLFKHVSSKSSGENVPLEHHKYVTPFYITKKAMAYS